MDIEELSKSQIVLLVLLISFVTSMATGIVTVSLMDQAPQSVASTVNRVIQQTIKEVSAPDQTASAAVASVPPKTVVIKQSDEIASAVAKASPSVVRLYSSDGTTFLGMGVVLDSAGTIVTDAGAVGGASDVSVLRGDGTTADANVTTRDTSDGIVLLSAATSTQSASAASTAATSTLAWTPIAMPPAPGSLGETVVLLAGETTPSVDNGLVSSLPPASAGMPALVKTNISGDNVLYGSPLIDTDGNLVGISTSVSRESSGSAYVPSAAIQADLNAKQ
jgi:S1-C subfamily serine protease